MVAAAAVDRLVPGPKTGLSEFIVVNGVRLHAFCGGCAAAHAQALSEGRLVDNALQLQVYRDFRALRDANGQPLMEANGATTMHGIIAYLRSVKVPIVDYHLYTGQVPLQPAYAALAKYAGKNPIIVQTATGQHMVDEITGAKMNASMTTPLSHFLVGVGRHEGGVSDFAAKTYGVTRPLPAGYWFADGDSMIVRRAYSATTGGRLVLYSDESLAGAKLDSYVVVGFKAAAAPAPAPTPAPTPAPKPAPQPEVQAEFPGALWMPHHHFWTGRSGHQARYIVIHGTASPGQTTAQQIAQYFQTTTRETGAHYVIGRDGTVVQMVREEDAAWGNGVVTAGHDPWWGTRGNPNLETISIEHVKTDPKNAEELTPAQAAASFRLVAYLCAKWGIPARPGDATGGIVGHHSIDPVNRGMCPGPYPWDALWAHLKPAAPAPAPAPAPATAHSTPHRSVTQALTLEEAADLFSQYLVAVPDPHTPGERCLARKDKPEILIRGGLLTGYLSEPSRYGYAGLESFGLPLANETLAPGATDAWVQWFELGGLADDPNHRLDSRPAQDSPYYRVHLDRLPAELRATLFPAAKRAAKKAAPPAAPSTQQ